MDLIVKWSSILSPLIAVIIAVWSGISSRKATAKQLSAIKESTTKQVESVKELTKIQIKLSLLQMEKDTWEARHKYLLASKKLSNSLEFRDRMSHVPMNDSVSKIYERREKDDNLSLEEEFYSKQISLLEGFSERIKKIMNEIDKG